jgi:dTDP-4-amino-4,6-dideoxy-D-glucose transaminase
MSEINAAFGLVQLKHVSKALDQRKTVEWRYRSALRDVAGIQCLAPPHDTEGNSSYFPIFVREDFPLTRDALYQYLKERGFYGRRYFYPLISNMPMYQSMASARAENLPVSNVMADQVLCLPIYPDLEHGIVDEICTLIRGAGHE